MLPTKMEDVLLYWRQSRRNGGTPREREAEKLCFEISENT